MSVGKSGERGFGRGCDCDRRNTRAITLLMELLASVATACRDAAGLQAAIVFGSALRRPDPGDLDVALLWSDEVPADERWRHGNRVAGILEQHLSARGLTVDIKDLRALPLHLQYRILQEGRAAYVADRRALV